MSKTDHEVAHLLASLARTTAEAIMLSGKPIRELATDMDERACMIQEQLDSPRSFTHLLRMLYTLGYHVEIIVRK